MNLSGTPIDIINALTKDHKEIPAVLKQVRGIVPPSTRAVAEYQAAALYALAKPYNRPGARVLEIGTAQGYSATILALAMPDADIITLNPHHEEAVGARKALSVFGERVQVIEQKSVDFLKAFGGAPFDFIFVDGDHKNVRLDLPWYKHLKNDAAFLFHDFSPNGTPRACPPVYRALLEFRDELGRDFDILIVDDTGVGMAGWYKRGGDMLNDETRARLATAQYYSSASYTYLTGLYQLAEAHRDIEGSIVECGVQNGGSAAALAFGAGEGHKLFVFDNFEGVPKPSIVDGEKAMQRWKDNQPDGWAKGSAKSVRECLKDIGVKGAKIVTGAFADTLPSTETGDIAILHIDATLHHSTRDALKVLYDRVVPGGLIIVSAYHHWSGVKQAVDEYFSRRKLKPDIRTLEKGAYWVK